MQRPIDNRRCREGAKKERVKRREERENTIRSLPHNDSPHMIHLTAVEKRASFPQEARFPYNVPVIARLESVRFETAVTFLVGGKGESEEERGERTPSAPYLYDSPHMIHLTAVEKRASFPQEARFPYNVPVIARLESVRFETAVTFLVGGKGGSEEERGEREHHPLLTSMIHLI